jgi:hypothetical protein
MIHDSTVRTRARQQSSPPHFRQAFVDQYSGDVLPTSDSNSSSSSSPEAAEKLPPPAAWRPDLSLVLIALFLCLVHPLWQLTPRENINMSINYQHALNTYVAQDHFGGPHSQPAEHGTVEEFKHRMTERST